MRVKHRIRRFWRRLNEIDYIEQLITGVVIGGIIGGLVFSIVSPLIVPPVQDAVIGSGFGPKPTPDMRLMYEDEPNNSKIQNSTTVSVNSTQYRVFYIVLRNPTNKLMTEMNLLFMFRGCPESSGTYLTSLDSAISAPDSDDIKVKKLLGGCGMEIAIEELPPQKWATVYVVIDTSETNNQLDRDLGQRQVVIMGNYEWQYNGRMYFTQLQKIHKVTDKLEKGDRLN